MELNKYPTKEIWKDILKRPSIDNTSLEVTVQSVLSDIKQNGQSAVKNYTLQFDKVDLENILVSNDEMQQQLSGNNPHPVIRQQFTDPKTQVYNPANVSRFLNSDMYKNNQDNWQKRGGHIEGYVRKDRLNGKYNKMIEKANYYCDVN